MCASGMWGQAYGGYVGMPLPLLGMLVFFVLLTAVIWFMLPAVHRNRAFGTRHEPQPHDELYTYDVPRESTLEVLRERYARGEIEP